MTVEQQLSILKRMTEETDAAMLSCYLAAAGEKICNRCYPFAHDRLDVPAKYHYLQVEIACYLFNKRGAEGQTSHNENGVNRSYESASVPESMLKNVVPFVSVFQSKGR